MPVLIQSLSFSSLTGNFDSDGDTRKVNETMMRLQQNGARILDVKVTIAQSTAIYLITYETSPTEGSARVCSNCRTPIPVGMKFCSNCGTRVS